MPLSPDPLSPLQSQTVKRPSAAVERAVAVHADAEYAVSAVNADTAAESPPREELPPGAALSASIRGATARPPAQSDVHALGALLYPISRRLVSWTVIPPRSTPAC